LRRGHDQLQERDGDQHDDQQHQVRFQRRPLLALLLLGDQLRLGLGIGHDPDRHRALQARIDHQRRAGGRRGGLSWLAWRRLTWRRFDRGRGLRLGWRRGARLHRLDPRLRRTLRLGRGNSGQSQRQTQSSEPRPQHSNLRNLRTIP